jgi:hypothetical protein
MASKSSTGMFLQRAVGIKNIFAKDWKPNFFTDPKKKIASIPFIRNIIEYTKGEDDPDFVKLTSLLHWKSDTASITERNLDAIYIGQFNSFGSPTSVSVTGDTPVFQTILQEATGCLQAPQGINFENKIVLSIAIRIVAERFMVKKINDATFVDGITSNQTPKLLAKFKVLFSGETQAISTIMRVVLMTPENIHLNSFMYEPILDMSDEHLRKLYSDVLAL